jgi:CysZ protein
MRHLPIEDAKRLRKAYVGYVSMCGLIIAVIASVPVLNLITPLFATAFMVRIYKQLAARAGLRFAPRLVS